MKDPRGFPLPHLLLGLAAVAIVATAVVYTADQLGTKPKSNTNGAVFCAADAKLCPDGVTYVGRQAPNCEFAACPATNTNSGANTNTAADATEGWKTHEDTTTSFSLRYPPSWRINETSDSATVVKFGLLKPGSEADIEFVGDIWVEIFASSFLKVPALYDRKQGITIGGQAATEYTNVRGQIIEPRAITVSRGSYSYRIAQTVSDQEVADVFQQLLGTIQFTDQTAATKDWKTVYDDFLGARWKIPPGEASEFSLADPSTERFEGQEFTGSLTVAEVIERTGYRVGEEEVRVEKTTLRNGIPVIILTGKTPVAKAEGLGGPFAFFKNGSILFQVWNEEDDLSILKTKLASITLERDTLPATVSCKASGIEGGNNHGFDSSGKFYVAMPFTKPMDLEYMQSSGRLTFQLFQDTKFQNFTLSPPANLQSPSTQQVKATVAGANSKKVSMTWMYRRLKTADGHFCEGSTGLSSRTIENYSRQSWTTYTDSELGFKVQVPPDWQGYLVTRGADQVTLTHPKVSSLQFTVVRKKESEVAGSPFFAKKDSDVFLVRLESFPVPEEYQDDGDEMDGMKTTVTAL